ncbi:hypothetical protein BH11ARM2_BH11ARM2_36950 [soil metagenome]
MLLLVAACVVAGCSGGSSDANAAPPVDKSGAKAEK